ncbi:MAG: class I SAM-dependent methyltransferase [Burkholderiaceae bacterium]
MHDPFAHDLSHFITNIRQDGDGIWRTAAQAQVSYPEEGHDSCHGVEGHSFWFAHRNRCIAAVIRGDPPDSSMPFADIGGGNGYVARAITDLGFRVVLIEPGASGIAHARGRGLQNLVQASILDLDVSPGGFGAIGLFDVLEHVEYDAEALLSLRSMLPVGGKLYATVPAHDWLWSSVDVEAGHFRRYTTARLRALLDRCGFDIELCSYFFWPLPLPMFLVRALPELLHLRSSPKPRQKRLATEHGHAHGIVDKLLAVEERMLEQGRSLLFGASCIVAATRRPDAIG